MEKSELIKKLISSSCKSGRKDLDEKLLFKVLGLYRKKVKKVPLLMIYKMLSNERPLLKLLKVRKSGRQHEVGIPLTVERSYKMGTRWLVKGKGGQDKGNYLYKEFDSLLEKSKSSNLINERNELYKVAVKNRVHLKLLFKVL